MFDDDYEDRMHDIRQDERQEKPVSDAAQKAVEKAIHERLVEMQFWDANAGGKTSDWWPDLASNLAAHVLAVLSETHAVVELPEPDDVGEWGSVWQHVAVIGTVQARPDGSCEIRDDFEYTYTAAELAEGGAILLAAARVAEGGGSRG